MTNVGWSKSREFSEMLGGMLCGFNNNEEESGLLNNIFLYGLSYTLSSYCDKIDV